MLLVIVAAAAFSCTLLGGLLALRLRDKLHLILGFSAGAVIGVAFFDLLPEAVSVGVQFHSAAAILSWTALGFLFYLVLDRILLFHGDAATRGRFAAGARRDSDIRLGRRNRQAGRKSGARRTARPSPGRSR